MRRRSSPEKGDIWRRSRRGSEASRRSLARRTRPQGHRRRRQPRRSPPARHAGSISAEPPQQKTPLRGGGALSGVTTGRREADGSGCKARFRLNKRSWSRCRPLETAGIGVGLAHYSESRTPPALTYPHHSAARAAVKGACGRPPQGVDGRPRGASIGGGQWRRLVHVAACQLAQVATPRFKHADAGHGRLFAVPGAKLVLKGLIDKLGHCHAALARHLAGAFQELGIYFDGVCGRRGHAWILPLPLPAACTRGHAGGLRSQNQRRTGIYWRIGHLLACQKDARAVRHPTANGSSEPHNRKRPAGEAERLLGLLQGGEVRVAPHGQAGFRMAKPSAARLRPVETGWPLV